MKDTEHESEDITSKEYLDKALENAKSWCSKNLSKHLSGLKNSFDCSIFHYVVDNGMVGYDMRLDEEQNELIRVSTEKLKWYLEKEKLIEESQIARYVRRHDKVIFIRGAVEVDPESMFVHEIVEYVIYNEPELLFSYLLNDQSPHFIAYLVENINRTERGLKEWPWP